MEQINKATVLYYNFINVSIAFTPFLQGAVGGKMGMIAQGT